MDTNGAGRLRRILKHHPLPQKRKKKTVFPIFVPEIEENNPVQKSNLRLESGSIEDVKIEIDILLLYEQYDEALLLINTSRERFGENIWA